MINKTVVENCCTLSIKDLKKYLINPVKIDGIPVIAIDYTIGEVKESLIIPIVKTRANFNGSRPWLLCPGCANRVYKLYSPYGRYPLRCRECWSLDYELHATSGCRETIFIKYRKAKKKFTNTRCKNKRRGKLLGDLLYWEQKAMEILKSDVMSLERKIKG